MEIEGVVGRKAIFKPEEQGISGHHEERRKEGRLGWYTDRHPVRNTGGGQKGHVNWIE